MLPPLFADVSAATWTDKEVLIAIGSVLAAVIPVVLFIVRYLTGGQKARIKQLERDLAEAVGGGVSPLDFAKIQAERDGLAGRVCLQDAEIASWKKQHADDARKHQEASAAHVVNLETARGGLAESERQLGRERNRIKTAMAKDGQTWNVRVLANAPAFRPLSPEGRRAPIISVLNLKGGVGKTTTTANLAAAYDRLGYRVLVIDLDLQGSLSGLFLDEISHNQLKTSEARLEDFLNAAFDSEFPDLNDYIQPILPDGKSGLVATSDQLVYAETNLMVRWMLREGRDVRFLLRKELHLKRILNNYDVILLDCPPIINVSCVNALAASDYLIVPVMPSRQATARVPVLLRRLQEFITNINTNLRILGILPNRTYGTELTYDEQDRLNELKDHCLDAWGVAVPVFKTNIPQNVVIRRAEDSRRFLQPDDDLYETYLTLAREIETYIPMFCRPAPAALPAKEAVG